LTASRGAETERRSGKKEADPSYRSASHRDRDRVLYSEAFRRLGGVTQVALGRPELVLHNRLTHSLKVEQVGLSIHSKLSATADLTDRADLHAIAAACLAHDIGHPPFGHAGEQELDAILTCEEHRRSPRPYSARTGSPCTNEHPCLLEDGFEGNAQTFRVLTLLSTHRDVDSLFGLDLTYGTLRATTKYPWLRGENPEKTGKWGAYDCDAEVLWAATGQDGAAPFKDQEIGKSLDAQIMDWADDISYAVHDIEDFFRSKHIPLADYTPDSKNLTDFLSYAAKAVGELTGDELDALHDLLAYLPRSTYQGSAEDHANLDRARSTMLTQFINAATLEDGALQRDQVAKRLNSIVKQLIWFHVIDAPDLANIQTGQRRVLREIFDILCPQAMDAYRVAAGDAPDEQLQRRLPTGLRRAIDIGLKQSAPAWYSRQKRVYRGLVDYIASLSDEDAYRHHAVLKGRPGAGQL